MWESGEWRKRHIDESTNWGQTQKQLKLLSHIGLGHTGKLQVVRMGEGFNEADFWTEVGGRQYIPQGLEFRYRGTKQATDKTEYRMTDVATISSGNDVVDS